MHMDIDGRMHYDDVVLKEAIGRHDVDDDGYPTTLSEPDFAAGHTFSHACIDYSKSTITFYDGLRYQTDAGCRAFEENNDGEYFYYLFLNIGAKRVG